MIISSDDLDQAAKIAARVEHFVRETVVPYENDPRIGPHGPSDDLVQELRALARQQQVLTPHILVNGAHLSQRGTAQVLCRSGLSPLGPVAVNTGAPDEGNMFLLGRLATPAQQLRFLEPLLAGEVRSAFFMTEPAAEGGAGSDPSMLKTVAVAEGSDWVISGRKTFITGAVGARVGIIMARTRQAEHDGAATLFLVELPHPAVRVERVLDTIDGSMPGGHATVLIEQLRVPRDAILGEVHDGFRAAQIRLAPARLSHCMRWLGAAQRCQEIATDYACRRQAFGKLLIDHEGVGFMLADNTIALKQAELMIDWCAGVLDSGAPGTTESSMTKVAVSEQLFRIADRCVQVLGGTGVSRDTVVEKVFRELRAFRIYDGPTEVHKWSIAKRLKHAAADGARHPGAEADHTAGAETRAP
jgi:acyl-CoA dehydrogenase